MPRAASHTCVARGLSRWGTAASQRLSWRVALPRRAPPRRRTAIDSSSSSTRPSPSPVTTAHGIAVAHRLSFSLFSFPSAPLSSLLAPPFLPCHPVCRHIAAVHLWFVVRVCLTATLLRFIIVRCFRVSAGLLNTCVDATGFDSSSVLLSPRGIILTILMFCDDVAVILGSFVF